MHEEPLEARSCRSRSPSSGASSLTSDGSAVVEEARIAYAAAASTINASSLAGRRRGLRNAPAPLNLHLPTHLNPNAVQALVTPPLSIASSASSEYASLRTPDFFCFDDPFDSPEPLTSPSPSTSKGTRAVSRTFRRLASRTQKLFAQNPKEQYPIALPAPPPMSIRPLMSPTFPLSPTSPLTPISPSPPQLASEWYNARGTREREPPPSPAHRSSAAIVRARSDSGATVQPGSPRRSGHRSEPRSPRDRRAGTWNRNDMREVVVGLRMLK